MTVIISRTTRLSSIYCLSRVSSIKNKGADSLLSDSLLGGGYLRLPASLTIGMVTLRALCQEGEQVGPSRGGRSTKKRGSRLIAE